MTVVDIKLMKQKAINFPEPIKSLILSEPDQMEAQDFISKFGTWDRLAKMTTAEVNKK